MGASKETFVINFFFAFREQRGTGGQKFYPNFAAGDCPWNIGRRELRSVKKGPNSGNGSYLIASWIGFMPLCLPYKSGRDVL